MKNAPFFTIETGDRSIVGALEWSGTWRVQFTRSGGQLGARAGMERTHFLLHPGEKVRMPRILLLEWKGDRLEAQAQFRQLIYRHYAARREGKPPLPVLFCNTCFTRGGGWLNECTAENQVSLIKAYGNLGIEALVTDAGWFTGGWPDGAGNWDVRRDAYPDGMQPVAAAARDYGMIYGLWFEPERVIEQTAVHREHPDWCLGSHDEPGHIYLLDFGRPEVQDYFFSIVKGFMDMPGFRFYRQDFNMDPLPYWHHNDAPGRQGITEARYVEGLYAYWDRIRTTWPDCIMEECASGGHRVDLGTVMRMHIHQKSDYWFDDEVDQASLQSVASYLPGSVMVAHLNKLDDYAFHSTLGSSLCLGWIADDPGFDAARASFLVNRYREIRHLLVGSCYPLLSPDPGRSGWLASQYHRPDLGEGMILAFRRAGCAVASVEICLHGLEPSSRYELTFDRDHRTLKAKGADLMKGFEIILPSERSSELITYKET